MSKTTQQASRCLSCSQGLDPDEPRGTTHADYYQIRTAANTVAACEVQWSETIASYCPNCINAFHLDRFAFDEPVPKRQPRRKLCECSYCDDLIHEKGEYFFVLHVVEYKHADDAEHLIAHSVSHAVICKNCDGAIDPLNAVLQKKHLNNSIQQLPEHGI